MRTSHCIFGRTLLLPHDEKVELSDTRLNRRVETRHDELELDTFLAAGKPPALFIEGIVVDLCFRIFPMFTRNSFTFSTKVSRKHRQRLNESNSTRSCSSEGYRELRAVSVSSRHAPALRSQCSFTRERGIRMTSHPELTKVNFRGSRSSSGRKLLTPNTRVG